MKIMLVFLFPILFVMCANQSSNSPSNDGGINRMISSQAEAADASMAEPTPLGPDAPPPPPPSESNTIVQQKLIRTADMRIEVDDYNDTRKELNNIFRKFNAQLSQEHEQSLDYRIENQLVIRVKPVLLDSLIEVIGLIASDIDHKNITSEDVTRQYVDLESRLASKRAVITQYQELLKSAKKISDILEINEKLNAVIEEIESAEAQLRTLRDQVQLSTLTLTIYENFDNIAARHEGFGSRLGNAFSGGWQGLLSLLVGLLYIWPLLLSAGILLFFLLRANRKRIKLKVDEKVIG